MTCTCGHNAAAVSMKCSIVQIKTFHCSKCGKVIREFKLTIKADREDLIHALNNLHKANFRMVSESRKLAINYIERTLDSLAAQRLPTAKSTREKRNDMWEKRFLKDQLGDDYYA